MIKFFSSSILLSVLLLGGSGGGGQSLGDLARSATATSEDAREDLLGDPEDEQQPQEPDHEDVKVELFEEGRLVNREPQVISPDLQHFPDEGSGLLSSSTRLEDLGEADGILLDLGIEED